MWRSGVSYRRTDSRTTTMTPSERDRVMPYHNVTEEGHIDRITSWGRSSETTKLIKPALQIHDESEVIMQMLLSTAILDAQSFAILSLEETRSLRKELYTLRNGINSDHRQLALDGKIKKVSENLAKLHGHVPRTTAHHVEDKHQMASTRVDELHKSLGESQNKEAVLTRRLLEHTAALLCYHNENTERISASAFPSFLDFDSEQMYSDVEALCNERYPQVTTATATSDSSDELSDPKIDGFHGREAEEHHSEAQEVEQVQRASSRSISGAQTHEIHKRLTQESALLHSTIQVLQEQAEKQLRELESWQRKCIDSEDAQKQLKTTLAECEADLTQSRIMTAQDLGKFGQELSTTQQACEELKRLLRMVNVEKEELTSQLQESNSKVLSIEAALQVERAQKEKAISDLSRVQASSRSSQNESKQEVHESKSSRRHEACEDGHNEEQTLVTQDLQVSLLKPLQGEIFSKHVGLSSERDMFDEDLSTTQSSMPVSKKYLDSMSEPINILQSSENLKNNQADICQEQFTASEQALMHRCNLLQTELDSMLVGYETLATANLLYEKQRCRLDDKADSLLERILTLEDQLAEEKIKSLAVIDSRNNEADPSGRGTTVENQTLESMRLEFRKIIKEMRAKHAHQARTDYAEIKRLERQWTAGAQNTR